MIQQDPHYIDTVLSDTAVPTADTGAYRQNLLPIVQGTTQTNRLGKHVKVCSIEIRWNAYRDPASTTHDRIRMLLVRVHTNDRATPYDVRDVIQTSNLVGNRQTDLQAFRRIVDGHVQNFTVLKDWYIDLGYTNSSKVTAVGEFTHRFNSPLSVWYEGSSSGTPTQNELILTGISDSGSVNPLFGFTARAKFIP
jgi:hypothetical protein